MKMNWKPFIFLFCAVILTVGTVQAQTNLLNAKTPDQIGKKNAEQLAVDNDKPLDYGYVHDRDLLWSKVVWEYIDLNEKINLRYYYPIHENSAFINRKSLFSTLMAGIVNGDLTEVYDDSYFTTKLTKREIEAKLFKIDTTEAGIDELNAGNTDIEEYINRTELSSRDIEGFKIKGVWYIDKRQGELKYRLLAIAPIAPDVQIKGRDDIGVGYDEKLPIFWVWYPQARQILHDMKVFNPKNGAYPISFDHLLNARRFSANIYREENIYGNRDISDYIRGNSLFQVLESQKIKDDIRNKELDLWNY